MEIGRRSFMKMIGSSVMANTTNVPKSTDADIQFQKDAMGEHYLQTFYEYFPHAPRENLLAWIKANGAQMYDHEVFGEMDAEGTYAYAVANELLNRLGQNIPPWWNNWINTIYQDIHSKVQSICEQKNYDMDAYVEDVDDFILDFIPDPTDHLHVIFNSNPTDICECIQDVIDKPMSEWSEHDMQAIIMELQHPRSELAVGVREEGVCLIREGIQERLSELFDGCDVFESESEQEINEEDTKEVDSSLFSGLPKQYIQRTTDVLPYRTISLDRGYKAGLFRTR